MTRKGKRYLLIFGIFAVAIAVSVGVSKLKPPPEIKEITDVEVLVELLPLSRSEVSFTVASQGNVRPRTETILASEISGAIVRISPKFVAGGVFAKNEELLRIDPSNYGVKVDQAEALVGQRQIEYDGALKLRSQGYRAEAELAAAAALLATAKADLVQARRNLERTSIRLPYEGMVRAKEVDLGSFVGPGTRLGVVFATDYAEVRLPLTDSDLAFVNLPDAAEITASGGSADGPWVELSAIQRGRPTTWRAQVVRTEGVVDERSRVTFAVARIADPYRLHAGNANETPLPMGTFVRASISGLQVDDVIRVPRSALRGADQLMFVDDDNRLRIRQVQVLRADAQYAYISGGAEVGERITVTVIEAPINGMRVKTAEDAPEKGAGKRLASGKTETESE